MTKCANWIATFFAMPTRLHTEVLGGHDHCWSDNSVVSKLPIVTAERRDSLGNRVVHLKRNDLWHPQAELNVSKHRACGVIRFDLSSEDNIDNECNKICFVVGLFVRLDRRFSHRSVKAGVVDPGGRVVRLKALALRGVDIWAEPGACYKRCCLVNHQRDPDQSVETFIVGSLEFVGVVFNMIACEFHGVGLTLNY
jgi:hypothetical protein